MLTQSVVAAKNRPEILFDVCGIAYGDSLAIYIRYRRYSAHKPAPDEHFGAFINEELAL